MINKIVTRVGSYALRKIGNATIDRTFQKINDPYRKLKKETRTINPLNVGEDESMRCYRAMPDDSTGFCRKVFEYEIDKYHKTGKYK